MPNKRSTDKRYVSMWINKDVAAALRAEAKKRGVARTVIISEKLHNAMKSEQTQDSKSSKK